MAFKKKNNKSTKTPHKLTRKQQRKEKRKERKVRRNDYFSKKKGSVPLVLNPDKSSSIKQEMNVKSNTPPKGSKKISIEGSNQNQHQNNQVLSTEALRKKEKKEQKKLESDMQKQRNKQLLVANKDEDKIIRQMEKQLGLKKRKSKSVPKSFSEDGLDFLLEVVDPEYLKHSSQKGLEDADNDFEEDFALMSGKPTEKLTKSNKKSKNENRDSDNESFASDEDDKDNEEFMSEDDEISKELSNESDNSVLNSDYSDEEDYIENEDLSAIGDDESDEELSDKASDDESDEELSDKESGDADSPPNSNQDNFTLKQKNQTKSQMDINKTKPSKRKATDTKKIAKKQKLSTGEEYFDNSDNSDQNSDISEQDFKKNVNSDEDIDKEGSIDDDFNASEDDNFDNDHEVHQNQKGFVKGFPDGTWEDIYGRLRGKDGSVILENKSQSKYIPPAIRNAMNTGTEDKKRLEKINRLRKQLKGLLNRLAESNMHSIASQIEDLYMNNSRNDMNDTLKNLIMESLVTEVMTPERLLIEHIVLLTILHANVGTEVGAHFLQHIVRKFDEVLKTNHEIENRTLDNIVCIIAQLYNFKLFDARLIYEVLQRLANNFKEKDVECILHILRNVGFNLRKADPIALKNLILELQKRAVSVSDEGMNNFRVKFMFDVLLAIKNNNVTKIPNYDVSYPEHLKKVMKGFIRKGNYVSELNIALEDLLKADEKGRWWVVGSAWTGNELDSNEKSENLPKSEGFSAKLLELAKKQRMNTDVRRNIFCIIMSAEDYLDAFEKLLKLGLKNQQEREIINVILHCCLQEKIYNPYYGHLAQQFCDYNRKYQMTIKYSIWDKLKAMSDHSVSQLSNLAKLLIHLFLEKGLPISTLKIVQFSELDKVNLRFMRQILLGILLHHDLESSLAVFARVAQSDKLKLFRESLRLFIHHFLLRNLKTDKVPEDQKELIGTRAKLIEKVLTTKEVKIS